MLRSLINKYYSKYKNIAILNENNFFLFIYFYFIKKCMFINIYFFFLIKFENNYILNFDNIFIIYMYVWIKLNIHIKTSNIKIYKLLSSFFFEMIIIIIIFFF